MDVKSIASHFAVSAEPRDIAVASDVLEKPDPNSTDFEDLALLANWKMVELLQQLRNELLNLLSGTTSSVGRK